MSKKRDYAKEYKRDHSSPEDIKKRSSRNKARGLAIKKHGKAAMKGKDVDHKDFNPLNNSPSNLRIMKSSANKKRQPKRK